MDFFDLRFEKISQHKLGILFEMLMDAYQASFELVERFKQSWQEFDDFVFGNLGIMDKNGFVMIKQGKPIGFSSWDPRKLPASVEIGHNCIIKEYQGSGLGKMQLGETLRQIKQRSPKQIFVKTGNTPFFLPARKMYESSGFEVVAVSKRDDLVVPEVAEYALKIDYS